MTDSDQKSRATSSSRPHGPDVLREELAELGGGSDNWEAQPVHLWPVDQQQHLAERVNAELLSQLTAKLLPDAMVEARSARIGRGKRAGMTTMGRTTGVSLD